MSTITVRAHYAQPPDEVWEELRHIERHVHWMLDAESITFDSEQREGVGTTFDCRTRVGPFRLTDHMTITLWDPVRVMGVTHRGLVKGSGTFTLESNSGGTEIVWRETLTMPWWGCGALGSLIASPVLRLIWKKNLRNLAQRLANGELRTT